MSSKMGIKPMLISIMYFLFVIGFFRGTAISGFSMFSSLRILDQLFTLFQYSAMVYILLLYIFKNGKISTFDIILWSYLILTLIATYISGTDMGEAITFTSNIFFVVLWFKTIFQLEDLGRLKAFVIGLNFLQIINFVFMLVFYGGAQYANSATTMGTVGHVYLLGYDNGLLMYVLPTIVLNYYLNYKTHECKYNIFSFIISMQVIISGSITGIIALILVALFFNVESLSKLFSGIKGVIISILAFIGLASLTIQQWFSPILESLGKGLTLSGRTEIWQWSYDLIQKSPLIGYGYDTERARTIFFWRIGISAAHSQLLDLLLQSGIIGFSLYLFMYVRSQRMAVKNYKISKYKYWKLLSTVVMIFFFVMIVESYSSYASYPLLFVLFAMSNFKEKLLQDNDQIVLLEDEGELK